jgi:hypothetical protein
MGGVDSIERQQVGFQLLIRNKKPSRWLLLQTYPCPNENDEATFAFSERPLDDAFAEKDENGRGE